MQKIIIGTRGSKLAMYQANETKRLINSILPNIEAEIKIIKTKGDKILDVALSKIGDKGLFTKEIEEELLVGNIDIAVHSLKDLPTEFPKGLKLGGVLDRENPLDALVSKNGLKLEELTEEHVIATSSLRRRAQLLAYNPKFKIVDIRGNVDTRLKKMEEGHCDAIILASAGLIRLGLEDRITQFLDPKVMVPATCQGIIGIEMRELDDESQKVLDVICNSEMMTIANTERTFLHLIEGGCQVPVGCYSELENETINFTGMVANLNGSTVLKEKISGNIEDAINIAQKVSEKLIDSGAKSIIENLCTV